MNFRRNFGQKFPSVYTSLFNAHNDSKYEILQSSISSIFSKICQLPAPAPNQLPVPNQLPAPKKGLPRAWKVYQVIENYYIFILSYSFFLFSLQPKSTSATGSSFSVTGSFSATQAPKAEYVSYSTNLPAAVRRYTLWATTHTYA